MTTTLTLHPTTDVSDPTRAELIALAEWEAGVAERALRSRLRHLYELRVRFTAEGRLDLVEELAEKIDQLEKALADLPVSADQVVSGDGLESLLEVGQANLEHGRIGHRRSVDPSHGQRPEVAP